MRTSYYAKDSKDPNAVAISRSVPFRFGGRRYRQLAPRWYLIKGIRSGDVTEEYYTKQYKEEVLDKLDPNVIARDLGPDAVLLCWEGTGSFCHRHLVAEWLRNAGISVEEET